MKHIATLGVLPLLLVCVQTMADSLPVTPGLWETTVKTVNPFSGTQTVVDTECLKDTEWDPATMVAQEEGCEVTDSVLDGDTLSFSMSCSMQGGTGEMTGRYTVDGDTGSGEMAIEVSFGGQSIKMESSMTSRRVGDC
jgi:hypothetical protein